MKKPGALCKLRAFLLGALLTVEAMTIDYASVSEFNFVIFARDYTA